MKFFKFIPLLNIILCTRTHSSLLPTNKICRDCKFYIPNYRECGKIPNVDLITGKISYNYASRFRDDEKQCGKEAKYFEKNNYKFITVPYYFMKDYGLVIFSCFIILAPLIKIKF